MGKKTFKEIISAAYKKIKSVPKFIANCIKKFIKFAKEIKSIAFSVNLIVDVMLLVIVFFADKDFIKELIYSITCPLNSTGMDPLINILTEFIVCLKFGIFAIAALRCYKMASGTMLEDKKIEKNYAIECKRIALQNKELELKYKDK